jgi:glycosyltransferase involved in cell wall biosynthesis
MTDPIKTDDPLVSVIIPTYNRSNVLPRTLSSLEKQTYKNLEVIVIDDASTDDTEKVAKSFAGSLNLVYLKNKINLKIPSRSRNIGLKKARGEYFALLDDDDEFLEKKIEIQLRTAQSLNEKAFILCNGYTFGKSNPYAYDLRKPGGILRWKKDFFPIRCELPQPSSWFFHRELVDKIGYFDEEMHLWDDVDYCLRLMVKYPVYMINQLLVNWNTTSNSLSNTLSNTPEMTMEHIRAKKHFLKKHFDLIRRDRYYLYKCYWYLGKDLKKMEKTADAAQYFRKAFFVKPYKFEALVQLIALSGQGWYVKAKKLGNS